MLILSSELSFHIVSFNFIGLLITKYAIPVAQPGILKWVEIFIYINYIPKNYI